ncbi:MAG: hypothetical protein ABSG68_02675 [Thermoguttaceae bacterium]
MKKLTLLLLEMIAFGCLSKIRADEPPVINPFARPAAVRDDAVPGYVELSDGSIHAGRIYLTRDKRLQVYDQQLERQREIPLSAVRQIECVVKRAWMEKEWRFKETTTDEKMFTGRVYPSREYVHKVTLQDGCTIAGPLSAVVYVQASDQRSADPGDASKTERFILNQRSKGELGKTLDSLVFVKWIKLGTEALDEGRKKTEQRRSH